MVDPQRPPTKKALPRRTHGWAYCGARAASGVFIGGRGLAAASTYVCIYVYMYVCMYVCMYVYSQGSGPNTFPPKQTPLEGP